MTVVSRDPSQIFAEQKEREVLGYLQLQSSRQYLTDLRAVKLLPIGGASAERSAAVSTGHSFIVGWAPIGIDSLSRSRSQGSED